MLRGLKENVLIGKLIPAGTGAREYADVGIELQKEFMSDDAQEMLEEKLMDESDVDAVEGETEELTEEEA